MDGYPTDGGEAYSGNLAPPEAEEEYGSDFGGYDPADYAPFEEQEQPLYVEGEDGRFYPVEEVEDGYPAEEYEPEPELDLRGYEPNSQEWNASIDALEEKYPSLKEQSVAEAFLDHAVQNAYALTGDSEAAHELASNVEYLSQLAAAAGPELQRAQSPEAQIDAYLAEKQARRNSL